MSPTDRNKEKTSRNRCPDEDTRLTRKEVWPERPQLMAKEKNCT